MKTIVIPLDGSELAARALPYATALARNRGARLLLVRSVVAHALFRADQALAESFAMAEADKEIEAAADRLRCDGLPVEAHVVYAPPAEGILTAVESVGADLVVMSTHGRGGLDRLVHGSVADSVLRRSPVPVLIVPPHARPVDWAIAADPVFLVALDGSELAEHALAPATDLARLLGARLLLLQVVEPLYSRYGYVESLALYGLVEPDPADMVAPARVYLESVAEPLRAGGIAVETLVEYGVPAETLAATAERRGALAILMATHGRGGLARLVLGSVATGLLKQSPVPLLLVHPAPESGLMQRMDETLSNQEWVGAGER